MRIAFLCKRRYMGKDVILDRYARLYEIPFQLALLGHDVAGFCLGYQRGLEHGQWRHETTGGSLRWESRGIGWLMPATNYPRHLLHRLDAFRPDLLIGASDIPHVALTGWLAKRLKMPYAVDLYDNFEGFGQARIPGMVAALRHAVRDADLVTTTSEALHQWVADRYRPGGPIWTMPSTVDKSLFRPMDRAECRRSLGLPEHARLIGTAGGLLADRGIGTLYDAWRILAPQHPDLHLVLAGPADPRLPPPTDPRVHYLGMLTHARTAQLFGALDVGVIYLRDTPFGRYCFPQKAYEMLACNLPVAAARLGAMADLFARTPSNLYQPDDATDLARTLIAQLDRPSRPNAQVSDWAQLIGELEPKLLALLPRAA